ncbi:P-loop containing nucleoside triphosphate hydrolase protein, partial [Mycena rebaudengoi]
MKVPTQLESLIHYTTVAASTVEEMAGSFQIPFLSSATALTLSILKSMEAVRSNRDEWMIMVEQIHEVLCTITTLCSTSEIKGVLPTALLYDIAKFTETLQKIVTVLNVQQKMGKIKQLLKQPDNAGKLAMCKQELSKAVGAFRVRAGGSTLSQIGQVKKDAKQQHEELMALLNAYPDLSSSDRSSVIGTLSSSGNSSGSFSLLPPSPKIFHGREEELKDVVNVLLQNSARVAILGTGGMGKTSLATAAIHDPQVEAMYQHRYFVQCHSSPTCSELAVTIAGHIVLEKGSNLPKKVAHYFAQAPASLLVLDNLETPWETRASRSEVEEFLSLLADVPHLGLMITLRGAERPSKVKWTRPFLVPLKPLSDVAARQTFNEIADDGHEDASVRELLGLTGNLPLAVSLIASVADSDGCSQALTRWKSESTRMLSEGFDQRSSLDVSIMLSYTGSRMTPGAQELLSVLSMLPDGLADVDLVQAKLPIPDILACKATLIRTALAFVGQDQHLKVLVPIREHIISIHPPPEDSKLKLREHFHQILALWNQFKNLNVTDTFPQISRNLGNFNTVLHNGLEPEGPDIIQTFESCLFLNNFHRRVHEAYSPLLLQLSGKMPHWKNHPMFGEYLIALLECCHYFPDRDWDSDISLGTEHFKSRDPLEQARWYRAVGIYFW